MGLTNRLTPPPPTHTRVGAYTLKHTKQLRNYFCLAQIGAGGGGLENIGLLYLLPYMKNDASSPYIAEIYCASEHPPPKKK